jgi:hypothetical protein
MRMRLSGSNVRQRRRARREATAYDLNSSKVHRELELELIKTQMSQKPMLRIDVHARAWRAIQDVAARVNLLLLKDKFQ